MLRLFRKSSAFWKAPSLPSSGLVVRDEEQYVALVPPINPTPRPYLRVSWIRTLPWVTWEAVTVVEGTP